MELYGFFRSSTSYRLRIALALKGLAYAPHYVSLPKGEHKGSEYLSLNPQGLVPALVDDGHVVTQSLAIIEYLEDIHPEPPLLPAGARERAYVRAVSQIIGCDIHPLNNVRVLKYLQSRWTLSDDERDEWYRHWIEEGFRSLEAFLGSGERSGPFLLGDRPGLGDVCLVPQIVNAERFNCNLSAFPTCLAIYERCMSLDAFSTTHPRTQPDAF